MNSAIMLTPEFLRRQAENCLRIARTCFDLASAERLRLMAADLNDKAAEIEEYNQQRRTPHHTIQRNSSS
jgi:2'-5' RNA ligase